MTDKRYDDWCRFTISAIIENGELARWAGPYNSTFLINIAYNPPLQPTIETTRDNHNNHPWRHRRRAF